MLPVRQYYYNRQEVLQAPPASFLYSFPKQYCGTIYFYPDLVGRFYDIEYLAYITVLVEAPAET